MNKSVHNEGVLVGGMVTGEITFSPAFPSEYSESNWLGGNEARAGLALQRADVINIGSSPIFDFKAVIRPVCSGSWLCQAEIVFLAFDG